MLEVFFVCCSQAVQCQQEECVAILLEHGADPNLADADGNTALHLAVLSPNTTVAGLLLEHNANIDAQNQVTLAFGKAALSKRCRTCVFLDGIIYPFRRDIPPLFLLSPNIIKRW